MIQGFGKVCNTFIHALLITACILVSLNAVSAPQPSGGRIGDVFSAEGNPAWSIRTGTKITGISGRLTVIPEINGTGSYSASVQRHTPTVINSGHHPILAVKLKKPAEGTLALKTNLGYYNNTIDNARTIKCRSGGDIYYWDISHGTFGNTKLTGSGTIVFDWLALEVDDIPHIRTGDDQCEFYWVGTFSSEHDMKAHIGWLDDDFSTNNTYNWRISIAGGLRTGEITDRKYHVVTVEDPAGTYRADLYKTGRVNLHAGNFPIVAVMMEKPWRCNMTFDTNLGAYNDRRNNFEEIELSSPATAGVYYWDLSRGTFAGRHLPSDSVVSLEYLQIKVADIDPKTDKTAPEFDVYWIKTFRSMEELRAETGYINDVFNRNGMQGWELYTEGASLKYEDDKVTVIPVRQPHGMYRGDIMKREMKFHAGNYPVIAIKMNKPPVSKLTFDTNYGSFDKKIDNHSSVPLHDGTRVYYWDLSKGTLGDLRPSSEIAVHTEYCRIKIADISVGKEGSASYDIYWVKSFRSVDDMNAFLGYSPWYLDWRLIMLCGSVILLLVTAFMLYRVRSANRKANIGRHLPVSDGDDTGAGIIEPVRSERSAVNMCGGLSFFDRDGREISQQLSPVMKQLFLAIFFYKEKTEKGITSQKIEELLWPDKTEESARNNRRVNISKLKAIFDQIGDINLVKDGSFWTLELNTVSSDYIEIMSLARTFRRDSSSFGPEEIKRFISLVLYGEILPAVNIDWLDEFKAGFTNAVIDTLEGFLSGPAAASSRKLRYAITDVILTHDHLNDKAIAVKCALLYKDGKKGLAKKVYDSFVKSYREAMGEKYPVPLDTLIKQ